MEQAAIIRLVAERELIASSDVIISSDDADITFHLSTISAEDKRRLRHTHDQGFPVPPVVSVPTPGGAVARFDLESADYQKELDRWHEQMSYGVLAATLGVEVAEVKMLEHLLPNDAMLQLFSTAELINGVQSDPLADLIKESIWSPEVLTWLASQKPKADEVQIADTSLFRQMEAMAAAGWKFGDWESATPRERLLLLHWYDYRCMREAYVTWWYGDRNKGNESNNPHRQTLR